MVTFTKGFFVICALMKHNPTSKVQLVGLSVDSEGHGALGVLLVLPLNVIAG